MNNWLYTRIPPGFRIVEALLYLCFTLLWPLILGSTYYLGNAFDADNFITLKSFVLINSISFTVKLLMTIPFWWLYFVYLRKKTLKFKIKLHVFTGLLFAALVVTICGLGYEYLLKADYPRASTLSDFYIYTVYYFFHFSLFHGYNFYLDQQKQHRQQQELQALAYESELKALKSQIQPHFLFNTLNSISASIPYTMEKTKVMIAQLADTFRYTLKASERDWLPLEEEINFIKNWLELEQRRFGDRHKVRYKIDESCLGLPFPPMLLQPLVENALKHGISPKIEGGRVTIECRKDSDYAFISVADTGVGTTKPLQELFNHGFGLSNTKKRIRLHFDEELMIEDNTPGLRFSFRIPLNGSYTNAVKQPPGRMANSLTT